MNDTIYTPFLYGTDINENICDSLITYWSNSKQKEGTINIDGKVVVDHEFKHSLDVQIPHNSTEPVFLSYLNELRGVAKKYIDLYPWCDSFSPWGIVDTVNIQYYPPKGGFKVWHTERSSAQPPFSGRHLVFMTFLNTVSDGGGTEFFHQDVIVNAQKGLTLIWPADWTFLHRGVVSMTEEKWIITGWFNFFN